MPRILNPRKVPLSPEQRKEAARKFRVSRSFVWIDPYPEIPGTKPEKMVYAELIDRQIPFKFQEWLHVDLAGLSSNDWYRPDFQLPEYKIIIEVQGAYWHTQPDQIQQDALKYSLYEMIGWKVVTWWDYDIETRLKALFEETPELRGSPIKGSPYPNTFKYYDDLKAIKKANIKRRKPWTKKAVSDKVKNRSKIFSKKQRSFL